MTLYQAIQQELKFRQTHNDSGATNIMPTDMNLWDGDDWTEVEQRVVDDITIDVISG